MRLKNYDYSSAGGYFITINTLNKKRFLGRIEAGVMHLSETGQIVESVFGTIAEHHPYAMIDTFSILPDHLHCILFLNPKGELDESQATFRVLSDRLEKTSTAANKTCCHHKGSISLVIQQFKAEVTRECHRKGISFAWQERFHERVIRSYPDYERITYYIEENVRNWKG